MATSKYSATVFPVNKQLFNMDLKHYRRRSLVREFDLNTSVYGISRIVHSHSIQNRIFWPVSLMVFVGVSLYFLLNC